MFTQRFAVVLILLISYSAFTGLAKKEDDDFDEDAPAKLDKDIGKSKDGSRTDDEVVQRWHCFELSFG